MGLADDIRQFVYENYIKPACEQRERQITIRAGDIHKEMGLTSRIPAVCSALGSRKFEQMYNVKLINREGPSQGANVFFSFTLECEQNLKQSREEIEDQPSLEDRLSSVEFETRVKQYVERKLDKIFHPKRMIVGLDAWHEFDLVSEDNEIVIECKSYTWTKSGNFPSGKISTANEVLFYLSRIQAEGKILIMQDDIFNGKSLVQTYVNRYEGLMDDVEIWTYVVKENLENDEVGIVREAKEIWYKGLFGYK